MVDPGFNMKTINLASMSTSIGPRRHLAGWHEGDKTSGNGMDLEPSSVRRASTTSGSHEVDDVFFVLVSTYAVTLRRLSRLKGRR